MSLAATSVRHDRLAATVVATHGEPVTLPGPRVVSAVVMLPGADVGLGASDADRGASGGVRVAAQSLPALLLPAAAVGTLAVRDEVMVRGDQYLVVSLTPDGAGMVRVDLLAPGVERDPWPEQRRWR
jgi:hypothetical protein